MNYTFNDIPQRTTGLKFYDVITDTFNLQVAVDTTNKELLYPLFATSEPPISGAVVKLTYSAGTDEPTVDIKKSDDLKRLTELIADVEKFQACALDGIDRIKKIHGIK